MNRIDNSYRKQEVANYCGTRRRPNVKLKRRTRRAEVRLGLYGDDVRGLRSLIIAVTR